MYSAPTSVRPSDESDSEEDMDIKKLLKEVEYLGIPFISYYFLNQILLRKADMLLSSPSSLVSSTKNY
jgi:hypothetical protein